MPPRVERASIFWKKLGVLFIALAFLISLGIGASFLSYEQVIQLLILLLRHQQLHLLHTRLLLPLRQPSIQR